MLKLLAVPFVIHAAEPEGRLLRRIRAHLTAVGQAHAAIRKIAEVPAEASRDAGLGAEALLGLPARQDALPFFMQAGSGRNREP